MRYLLEVFIAAGAISGIHHFAKAYPTWRSIGWLVAGAVCAVATIEMALSGTQ